MVLLTYNAPCLSIWAYQRTDMNCLVTGLTTSFLKRILHEAGRTQVPTSFPTRSSQKTRGWTPQSVADNLLPFPLHPNRSYLSKLGPTPSSPFLKFSKLHTHIPRSTIKLIRWPHGNWVSKIKQSISIDRNGPKWSSYNKKTTSSYQ